MSRRFLVLAAVVATAAVATGAAAQEAAPGPAAEIDAYLERCAGFGFSGSVLVAKGGKVLLAKGYGLADRANGVANTPETLFEIASASKQITAAAVLKLEAMRKLSTDDAVTKHLPDVPDAHDAVTIAHLLHHTSGFPRAGPGGGGPDLSRAVKGYLSGRRTAEPGARFEYWNGGYALLSGIVETVSGTPFQDFCRNELFAPAGMTRTGFCRDSGLDAAREAHGYDDEKDAGLASSHSFGWEYRGMGGVVTSVLDLSAWDRALRTDAVLPEAQREKLFAPGLGGYACGWFVEKDGARGRVALHGGTVAGFETQLIRWLDEDAFVAVLANGRGTGWQVGYHVADLLCGGTFPVGRDARPPAPPATIRLPAEALSRCAGRFELPSGAAFVVRADGARLVVGAEGQEAVDALAAPEAARDARRHAAERRDAQEILTRLAKGDVALLRERMGGHIPKSWPDTMKGTVWPRHAENWGALTSVREIGARSESGGRTVRVWVRLVHERGETSAEVAFAGDRLVILDLNGREFPVRATYLPVAAADFVSYAFGRPVPVPLTFERATDGGVPSVRGASRGAASAWIAKRAE